VILVSLGFNSSPCIKQLWFSAVLSWGGKRSVADEGEREGALPPQLEVSPDRGEFQGLLCPISGDWELEEKRTRQDD